MEESPSSSIPSRVRFVIALTIVLMVISSPTVMLVNPALKAAEAPFSTPSTLSQDGSDFTTQAAIGSLTARPTNNIVNTKSFYDVVFVTSSSGAIKFIQITFPAGTAVPHTAVFNEAEKCVPGGSCTQLIGSVSQVSGQTITYTVSNAVNVPADAKIRFEFSNITNPPNPGANYKITVTTRDANNGAIDGPTQSSAYTIKQIGTNAIAANSIVPVVITRLSAPVSVDPDRTDAAIALCEEGEQVVSGGYSAGIAGANGLELREFDKLANGNGWFVDMYNPDTIARSFQAIAECMPALP